MKPSQASLSATVILMLLLLGVGAGQGNAGTAQPLSPGLLLKAASLDTVEQRRMAAPDIEATLAMDAARRAPGAPAPLRFAVAVDAGLTPKDAGTWEELPDGSSLWRLRIASPGALNLNLAFDRFELPAGARLWVYGTDGRTVRGPYTRGDRNAEGAFWTPIVPGDEVAIELHIPVGQPQTADLRVAAVNHGFRQLDDPASAAESKQGSCNIDVICPEGDAWRDQIRSTARITILGAFVCTGQLVNTTAQDGTPYFLTAQHCVENASQATTVVAFWNYESPECGLLAGGELSQSQSGATLVSIWEIGNGSDFALLLLDEVPDPTFNVYYAGWDASGEVPVGSVGIHHPRGDEKAISFDNDPPTKVNHYGGGNHQWRIGAWDLGTTEGGSSGSCIFDVVSQRCIGTLTAGTASCSNPNGFDIYGRMDVHWTGDGTQGGRLSDWLDPIGSGALTVAGRDSSSSPPAVSASFTFEPINPTIGASIAFTDTSTGSPTSWSWSFGDGGTSTEQNPIHVFSTTGTFTVDLTATNTNGSSTASTDITVTEVSSPLETYIIAAAGLTAGLEGSFFQTDVDINNGADTTAMYNLTWLPRGEDNSSPATSGTFTLGAGASVRYENVLSEVFGLEPNVAGALAVNSNTTELTVMSRTYNLPQVKAAGTFGQAIPGIPSSELIGQNDVRRIVFMSENDDLRSNIGCANGVDDTVLINIELYRQDGALLDAETMALAPFSNNQINQIFADYAPTNGYVDVSSAKANAGFFCYGSVLDNGSSDPTTVLPQ